MVIFKFKLNCLINHLITLNHFLKNRELLILCTIYILFSFVFFFLQRECSFNDGFEWDGVYYKKITEDFAESKLPSTYEPFVYRIGIPFIVSQLPFEIKDSWLFLAAIFSFSSFVILHYLIKSFVEDSKTRIFLMILYLINFRSPIKAIWYAPASLDHFDKLFLFSGLLVLSYISKLGWNFWRTFLLVIIVFFGVLCREIVAVIAIAGLFAKSPVRFDSKAIKINWPPINAYTPIIAFIISFFLIKEVVHPIKDSTFPGFLSTSVFWLFKKSLPELFLTVFISFSPALILIFLNFEKTKNYLIEHQYLAVYLFFFLAFGYIGGSASHRLFYWGIPAVLILIGISIENIFTFISERPVFIGFLFFFILLSQRVFWTIPDYPGGLASPIVFLTPLTSNANVLDIIGMGSLKIKFLSFITYLIVLFFLIWLFYREEKK